MYKILTHEELERKNFLLIFKSKEEIVDMLLWYEKENTKLKKELEITTFNFQSLNSACSSLAEFMGLDKDSIIEEMIDKVVKDRKEKNSYKSVLKEIREYIKEHISYEKNSDGIGEPYLGGYEIRDLLEIIDKGIKKED